MKVDKKVHVNDLAKKIVDTLTTCGTGERGTSLSIIKEVPHTAHNERTIGGWCINNAVEVVADVLRESLRKRKASKT